MAGLQAQTAANCRVRTAEDFEPMTRSERVAQTAEALIGSEAFVYTGIRAGVNQELDRPTEWGQGARGYGLRMGSIYGEYAVGQVLKLGIAYARREDNRYFASGERGFGRRLGYAVMSTILARRDDGSRTISLSAIGSTAGAALVSREWQPRSTNGAGAAAKAFGLAMGTRMVMNLMREFSPRVLGRLLR
jgi:hypothetical protein